MPLGYVRSHFSVWPILLPFWTALLTWFKPSSCLWLCSASCYSVHYLGDLKNIWKNVIGMTTSPWTVVVVVDIDKQVQSPLYGLHFSLVFFMSKETTDGTFASFTITSLFPFFILFDCISLSITVTSTVICAIWFNHSCFSHFVIFTDFISGLFNLIPSLHSSVFPVNCSSRQLKDLCCF